MESIVSPPKSESVSWRALYLNTISSLSPGVLMGLLCGALIGGVGGRLAMLLLRLTSSDALHGMKTDDEFTIGVITGDSFFLLAATTFLGILGGVVYLMIREWLPEHGRPVLTGLLAGTIGGAVVIRPGGVDFTALEPLSLAVILFIALPATYGALLSILVERHIDAERKRSWVGWFGAIALVLPVLMTGPFGLGLVGLFAVCVALNRSGGISRLAHSTPSLWTGRCLLLAVLIFSASALARDIAKVL